MAYETLELVLLIAVSCFLEVLGGEYCYVRSYYSNLKYCSGGCCGSYASQYCCAVTTSIIGGVIGAVIFIGLIIALIVCCSKTQRGRNFRQRHWGGGRVVGGGATVTVIGQGQPKVPHQMRMMQPPPYSIHAPPGQAPPYNTAQAYPPPQLPGQMQMGYGPPPGQPAFGARPPPHPQGQPYGAPPPGGPPPRGAPLPPGAPPPPAVYHK